MSQPLPKFSLTTELLGEDKGVLSKKIFFSGQETEARGEHILVHIHQSLRSVLESYTFH